MSTFHQFSLLPTELQLQIWQAAVATRYLCVVKKQVGNHPEYKNWPIYNYVLDPTLSPPALVHTCRESRNLGLYRKAFLSGTRYHWVNFDLDILQIKFTHIRELESPDTALVKHVRVEVKVDGRGNEDEEWLYYIQRHVVNNFSDVRTFEFLVDEDLIRWTGILRDGGAGRKCQDSDFRVIDVRTGNG